MVQTHMNNVEVAVVAGVDGSERIVLRTIDAPNESAMTLTPTQARLLATELIAAVNRAEVKASLKVGGNMWRRPGDARNHLVTAG